MRLSSLNRPSAPRDQRESVGIRSERYWEMEVSEGRAERMSLWIVSTSTMELARCRQDNGPMRKPPLYPSFGPQDISLSLQVKNPPIGMLFLI